MLRWSPYVRAKFEKALSVLTHTLKLHAKTNKSSITRPWIIRFLSNFVKSLNAWHPKCCKSSRSRGQRSKSRRDITCAKIRKIINNSTRYWSISLKFRTNFDHMTLDVPRTFKVNGSKVKVTAWHNVPASKTLQFISGTDKLSKVKLGENYPGAERNT